ncbi:hypothetical protein [Streptomyces caelestis]|uniref:hypothetical protein n=1 Tax=Streptomyces caelestis TaxID=36816 RepID=UPI0036F88399
MTAAGCLAVCWPEMAVLPWQSRCVKAARTRHIVAEEARAGTVGVHEVVEGSVSGDTVVVEDIGLVGVEDAVDALGDHLAFGGEIAGLDEDALLDLGVKGAGGLVADEDLGVPEAGPGRYRGAFTGRRDLVAALVAPSEESFLAVRG